VKLTIGLVAVRMRYKRSLPLPMHQSSCNVAVYVSVEVFCTPVAAFQPGMITIDVSPWAR
jgi:hypothetical protein